MRALQYNVPARIDSTEILKLISASIRNLSHNVFFNELKTVSNEDDKRISDWLNISEKTFRNYRSQNIDTKPYILEHAIMLISLFKHGTDIFGNSDRFKEWLTTPNFHFDQKAPVEFVETASGIKLIDNRLTGIEFGDNA